MRVLLLTEGNIKEVGFGHLTRCLALSQAIKEVVPAAKIKFGLNGDKYAQDFLKIEGIDLYNFAWQEEQTKVVELAADTDFVIIDSYLAPKSLYDEVSDFLYKLKGNVYSLLMLDDYNRLQYPRGIVVNPSIGADRLNYQEREGSIFLSGKDYVILRKDFWNIPEKVINKEVKDVLVSFGGISFDNSFCEKIINCLEKEFNSDLNIMNTQNTKVNIHEMLNLMMKADLAISAGGQTTYELARVGVPTVAIRFADNQRFNLEGLEARGVIEYIGGYSDSDLIVKLSNSISKLSSFSTRVRRSQKARDLINGKGVKNIVRKVMEELN